MTQTTQVANLKNVPDQLWKIVLEFADNNAASSVCKVLRGCQGSLINQLWSSFKFNSPLIQGWLNQNTSFGNKPRLLNGSPSGDQRLQLSRLLRSGMQRSANSAPIHPLSFETMAKTTNDRNLVTMFPAIKRALQKSDPKKILPDVDMIVTNPNKPDEIRAWIDAVVAVLKVRYPDGRPMYDFDFTDLGLTAIPKELAAFKPYMAKVNFNKNSISLIPEGLFSDCPYLQILLICGNPLRNLPSDFFSKCPRLKSIFLSHNRLEEIPSGCLSNCPSLEFIDLTGNRLEALPSSCLSNCPSLTTVNLGRNRLRRLPRDFLSKSLQIGYVDLSGNQLVDDGLPFLPLISTRPRLLLNIKHNQFTKFPEGFGRGWSNYRKAHHLQGNPIPNLARQQEFKLFDWSDPCDILMGTCVAAGLVAIGYFVYEDYQSHQRLSAYLKTPQPSLLSRIVSPFISSEVPPPVATTASFIPTAFNSDVLVNAATNAVTGIGTVVIGVGAAILIAKLASKAIDYFASSFTCCKKTKKNITPISAARSKTSISAPKPALAQAAVVPKSGTAVGAAKLESKRN
ncbi:MAG TPA: leucine-rich repeat protein [Chlamydiales bacterium]|nr:leucine-rich repeat protein [Chlamydiales bacterium]